MPSTHKPSSKWLLIGLSLGFWTLTNAVAPQKPATVSVVDEWVRSKCGGVDRRTRNKGETRNQQLWKYQGSLYDPLDGRRVATVLGLELVSLLPQNETTNLSFYKQVLDNANNTFHRAQTLWSKNIFCYAVEDGTSLLRNIKVRPYSPEKRIPLEQSVAVYETATTFVERTEGSGNMLIYSEWANPNNHKNKTLGLWSEADPLAQKEGMGFSVYAKLRNPKSPLFLPDLSPQANQAAATKSTNDTMVVSPKRSSWIQFGLSNMESKHKFGARETYSMATLPPTIPRKRSWLASSFRLPFGRSPGKEETRLRLTYSRYGEGPPFYAPGRMCMLELQAEPIDGLEDAPAVLQSLVRTKISNWNPSTPFPGFGTANTHPLRLVPSEEDIMDHDRLSKVRGHVVRLWDQARPITRLVSIFQNEKRFW